MSLHRTIDGDMVDAICHAHYGSAALAVLVYEANPGLAERGPILPMGILITLPEVAPEPTRTPVRLW